MAVPHVALLYQFPQHPLHGREVSNLLLDQTQLASGQRLSLAAGARHIQGQQCGHLIEREAERLCPLDESHTLGLLRRIAPMPTEWLGRLIQQAALAHEMEQLGVNVHWNCPKNPADIRLDSNEWLLDCRGLGARPQWPALRGVRGEVIRIHAPGVTLQRPTRLVHPRYPIYIAPKPDHVFVIGATEIESEDLSPPSVRSSLELLSAAYAVHPGFAEARILEITTQCRPTLADNLPMIRQTAPRTLEINGLYRHGYMIAPAMLDVTLEVLATGQSTMASRFDLSLQLLGER